MFFLFSSIFQSNKENQSKTFTFNYYGNERYVFLFYRDIRKQKAIPIQEKSRQTQHMHTKMRCKFSDYNEYNPQKRVRGFKQRKKCEIKWKKHKLFFECKNKRIQGDCRIYDSFFLNALHFA